MGTRTGTLTARDTSRRQQAEQRLRVIRNALEVADEELERALIEKDWEVFGLASFEDYCAVKLPELRHIKLRVGPRRERAARLLGSGATEREIAAATGSSPATAHRDVLVVSGRAASFEASHHAVQQPAPAPADHVSNVARAVALVAAQGDRGLTYLELCEKARWRGGQATGALSKAHHRGLIVPSGRFRDRCRVYLRP